MPDTAAPATTPFQVMTKPMGPRCNLDCKYCYYLEKERFYPQEKKFRMSQDVLETYIRDYIAAQVAGGAREIWFSWQGGEPTLLGVEYFRNVVALERKYCPPGVTIQNAFQTNATLIDDEWAAFFKQHDFLIGVSIDGPQKIHDRYRYYRNGGGSFDKVMEGIRILQAHEVEMNALVVVQRENARKPKEVYRFLKKTGFKHIQFIPIVERETAGGQLAGPPQTDSEIEAQVSRWSVLPKDFGDFLNAVFDEWIRHDVGEIFVQFFEVQLGLWLGRPAGLCIFAEECGQALAMEHNGDLFACDHYVYPEFKLGNIMEEKIETLAARPEQRSFGEAKRTTLPGQCQRCDFRFACNGGCPKHRMLLTSDGEPGLNYFCGAYMRFFRHARPWMNTMAELYRHGRPLTEIMEIARRKSNRQSRRAGPR
ncbi:MAG: anaerobic sulfatase maturase [Tropicimonas sp.]|uniref:anaerobic sulfatase maturase n=1 Tax=Tropicimonas sp. TaxID=2067044 RepID=UPI003A875693